MDELQFRRKAYGEPNCKDEAFLAAMYEAPERVALVKNLLDLDGKLERALKIDVPEGLAAKLLLNQQLHQHQAQRKKAGFTLALVASIAFIAGLSFTLLRIAPVDLSAHALAHVNHEAKALSIDNHVSLDEVNFQLASLGGLNGFGGLGASMAQFTDKLGKVYFSAYCDFQGVQSLHLVVQGEHGKVTLFIVPIEDRMVLEQRFADNHYQGRGLTTSKAYMLLVGDNASDLDHIDQEIKQIFI